VNTVTLLDINGNSIWQYSTLDSYSSNGNTITYKEIDAKTDMMVTSNSNNYITYNKIISSTSIPFQVDNTKSKTFTDPNLSNTNDRRVSAVFIIDENNAKSLTYDAINKKC
jgi:hypothetical protein